jgi:hypothetical protein
MRRATIVRETAERRAAATAAPAPAAQTARPAWETSPAASLTPNWIHNLSAQPLDDEQPGYKHQGYIKRRYGGPLDVLVGRGVRFVLAAVILAGFGVWFRQNSLEDAVREGAKTLAVSVDPVETAKRKDVSQGKEVVRLSDTKDTTRNEPLRVTAVPNFVCDAVGSWSGGIAGLLLLLSCVFVGKRYGVAVIASAGVILFGHASRFHVPVLQGSMWLSAAAGLLLFVAAVMFLRRRED